MNTQLDWYQYEYPSRKNGPLIRARMNVLSEGHEVSPIVLFLTGDGKKGSNSSSWANLPPLLKHVGIRSYLFDFIGLGNSEGSRETLTLTEARQDLSVAFEHLKSVRREEASIAAFASSFGAAALLGMPAIANACSTIVLKSPAPFLPQAYLNEIGPEGFRQWVRDGFSVSNGYKLEVLEDAYKHDIWSAARGVRTESLIIHGTSDEIVPYAHSELLRSIMPSAHLEAFEGVGHNYSEPGAWDRMARISVDWLKSRLLGT